MNFDELTLGQIKEIKSMFGGCSKATHPHHGKKVVAVLPNGFIQFGVLSDEGGRYILKEASNLRYWKQRGGGLPEFAKNGPVSDDKIDAIGEVCIDSLLFTYVCGDWT